MAEKNRRVMLKLSGEALAGEKHFGFDDDTIRAVAQEVKTAVDAGVQLAIVIGGGNFWRGRQSVEVWYVPLTVYRLIVG